MSSFAEESAVANGTDVCADPTAERRPSMPADGRLCHEQTVDPVGKQRAITVRRMGCSERQSRAEPRDARR